MTDRIITAPADKVSAAAFLDAVGPLFGKPQSGISREEQIERDQARREHQAAMRNAPSDYWERQRHDDECCARYAARLREIAERHAEQLVEVEHIAPGRIAA